MDANIPQQPDRRFGPRGKEHLQGPHQLKTASVGSIQDRCLIENIQYISLHGCLFGRLEYSVDGNIPQQPDR